MCWRRFWTVRKRLLKPLGLETAEPTSGSLTRGLRFSPKRTEARRWTCCSSRRRTPEAIVVAIEAKFAEAYDGKPRRALGRYYRTRKDLIAGWTHVARLVRDQAEQRFRYFDLSQTVRQLMALRQTSAGRVCAGLPLVPGPGRDGSSLRRTG
jgi:hypothetical protein